MLPTRRARRLVPASMLMILAAGGAAGWSAMPAIAQPDAAEGGARVEDGQRQPTNEELLGDFVHYTLIDNPQLAASYGQAFLDKNLDAKTIISIVENSVGRSRFDRAIRDALYRKESEAVAGELSRAYENAKLSLARDEAAIGENIAALVGPMRAKTNAIARLRAAGEFAMPQLLPALLQRRDPVLRAEVQMVIISMGRQAVIPLVTALPNLNPQDQEVVVRVLGDIRYGAAVPFLYELHARTQSEQVRSACEDAVQKIVGTFSPNLPLSARFVALGEEYYDESPSLTSFSGEPQQLLWSYDPGNGLLPLPIATEVFHEAMAMRLAERGLSHDPGDPQALGLWLASNFSREIDTPEGYVNPSWGPERRDAMYYAVAAGSTPSQRVLARAIDDNDTPLARRAISAIEQTAGGSALWTGQNVGGGEMSSRSPLLEALQFPNRRVQYEAALALGSAQPKEAFPGAERVVPTLAGAIRDASKRYAVVLSDQAEVRVPLADALRQQGYEVLPPAGALNEIEQAIADAPGVDLIVADYSAQSPERTIGLIEQARSRPKLRNTPVAAILTSERFFELSPRFAQDDMVRLVRSGVEPAGVAAGAEELVQRATGGVISPEEALQYKDRALSVLRDVAVSGGGALAVSDAGPSLAAALKQESGEMKARVAEVLAYIPTPGAQNALMDSALEAAGEERVTLLNHVAASARRFGNMLDPRQVRSLMDVAIKGEGDEATAAAGLMGSLNLPNSELIPLITGQR